MEAGALHAPAGLNRIAIGTPLLRLRSDDQLVAAFRAGNEEAFQVIFDRYRQRLFAYTRQMLSGSRQDAEDALQDVFLRAYAALRANDRPVSLRAWLYRVAHNRCIDQLRRPAPAQSDVFDLSRAPLRDPIEESQRREDLRRLVEDVQRLPQAQRSALLMREMDGLSYQELADALEVTVPAIKSLLVRARIGLVEAIEARDTACAEIRTDLMASYDRGVRASGKARRHLRDCAGCRAYRTELRTVQRGLGALSPGDSGPFGLLAKLFGIGGGAGGAAAGGGAVLGGGSAAVAGGGVASVTACKVAALVCSAAFVTGAAGGIERAVQDAVVPASPHSRSHEGGSGGGGSAGPTTASHFTVTKPTLVALPAPAGMGSARHVGAAATGGVAGETAHHRRHSEDVDASASVAALREDARPLSPGDTVYASPAPSPPPTNTTGGAAAPEASTPTSAPTTGTTATGGPSGTATAPAPGTSPSSASTPGAGGSTTAAATTPSAATAAPTTSTTAGSSATATATAGGAAPSATGPPAG